MTVRRFHPGGAAGDRVYLGMQGQAPMHLAFGLLSDTILVSCSLGGSDDRASSTTDI
jgi:hypothetical protein